MLFLLVLHRMKLLVPVVFLFLFGSCGVQYRLAGTEAYEEDSSFVYRLPFPENKSHLLVQGYNSLFSHRGRFSLDFKMKSGTSILAARAGVVVRVEENYKKGGVSKRYSGKANLVVIRHSDGSNAYYGHLLYNGALVNVGDSVKQGQVIAKSGSTGFSAFPHLHFTVWGLTPNGRKQLPTRFLTKRGIEYLKPGRWYRAL